LIEGKTDGDVQDGDQQHAAADPDQRAETPRKRARSERE
jgi:hypothetical protein